MKTALLSKMSDKFSRKMHKMNLKVKKYSPEILVVSGVVGVVASAVMACRATTKLDEVMSEPREQIDKIHEAMDHPEKLPAAYTKEDGVKDLAIVYTQTGVKLVKLYAPSIVLGAVSITAILKSHDILRKRNVALAAAYATIDRSFKEYRNRVIERFGKELDKELRYNIKVKDYDEVKEHEDGTKEVSKTQVAVADTNLYSDYAKFFDSGCTGWSKDPELNLMFLRRQQAYANDTLKRQGYLFLNDVYEMLGIPKTSAGQIVGWIYDEKNPIGDNFVDFGIYNVNIEKNRDFVNGYERTILLDFNVDGNILDLI